MKIIREGKLPKEKIIAYRNTCFVCDKEKIITYRNTCFVCDTVYEYTNEELEIVLHSARSVGIYICCPFCKKYSIITESEEKVSEVEK